MDAMTEVIINFHRGSIDEYDEMASVLFGRGSYTDKLNKLDLDLKN